jgi:hypothetical protein
LARAGDGEALVRAARRLTAAPAAERSVFRMMEKAIFIFERVKYDDCFDPLRIATVGN